MKEALVEKNLSVEIHDIPVPKPGPEEVLIKVEYAGSNPKDWKYPAAGKSAINSGDDMAGTIEAVGEGVLEFKKGDRVAGMHKMRTPGGSFAEYGIAPITSTFHIPEKTSAEEAATIPLAALTAVLGLYYNLELPSPWTPAQKPTPLIIYGASSAVGAFAVKLALRSNIHPIIAIAGKSKDLVEGLLDSSQGDLAVDYRGAQQSKIETVQKHLSSLNLPGAKYAFDCIGDDSGLDMVSKMLDPDDHLATVHPNKDYSAWAKSLTVSSTYVGDIHGQFYENKTVNHVATGNAADFGYVYSRLFTRGLQEGWLTGHPFEAKAGGLNDISEALQNLKDGKVSGSKYVFKIS